MDTDDPTTPDTLLSVAEAAAALGLRPATIKQYIQTGKLAAVRLPQGQRARVFIPRADITRYRRDSLGSKGWDKRKVALMGAKGEDAIKGGADEEGKALH